jgi:hypothetical protein
VQRAETRYQLAVTRAGSAMTVLSQIMGTKAERRAARERVSAYHQAQLTGLLTNVAAAVDRYRSGEIDAYTVDETIHHYHRAAGELWKFCFSGGGGSHDELIASVPRSDGRRRGNHRLVGTLYSATAPVKPTHRRLGPAS